MSTYNHTDIATGASANAGTINNPLGQLDAAIGNRTGLNTTNKASAVAAINEVDASIDAVSAIIGSLVTLRTSVRSTVTAAINELADDMDTFDARVDAIVAGTGDDIVEVADARDGETALVNRLDKMDDALQMTALELASATTLAATSVTLRHWSPLLAHGVWLVIDPFTADCEVRRVTSASGDTVTFAGGLQYVHAAGDLVLLSYAGEINALWFGASPNASAATNGVAFGRMIAQAKIDNNPMKMYIPGASDPYQYDTTIIIAWTGAIYGLAIRGDGMARRGEVYTHGTVLEYTPADASNAVEIGNGTNACRNLSMSNLTIRCNRTAGHTGHGILARYVGYTSDMLHNVAVTLAGVGIRTQDCWGSTWRNVDVSFCDLGASINAMNAGAWIGGGARSCYGPVAVSFGDANTATATNHLVVFRMSDLDFEGNAGDCIWLSRTTDIVTPMVYYGTTIDNIYFEANGGDQDLYLGHNHGVAGVSFAGITVRNCKFEKHVLIGRNVRNFVFGPNRWIDDTYGYTLESGSGNSSGIFVGSPATRIKSAIDTQYTGGTYRFLFQNGDDGVFSLGIPSINASYNQHSKLYTPLLKAYAIGTTVATADWRLLAGATLIKITHASATNFTEITNVPDHTLLMLKFQNANTTVVHNASKIVLRGAANWNPAADEVLTLISDAGVLYEVNRSAA